MISSKISRREMLSRVAASVPVLALGPSLLAELSSEPKRLGICAYSYNLHWKAAREGDRNVRFKDTLQFLDYCHQLGAGGVQVALGSKELDYAARARAKAESYGMYFEGQISLPKDSSEVDRFAGDLRALKEAGASIVRAALLGGRRYETFDSAEAFRNFAETSWKSLTLAEPLLKKQGVRLAVENHKDRRASEFVEMLKRIGSEWVGVCLDFGNNLALLEEPMAVVEALAPFAISSHLKDMAVQEFEQGFLLSEVPLGDGFLDLNRMITLLRRANPKLNFCLEMITRDPLKIPCLTQKYFATMPAVSANELASTLSLVREHASKKTLPHTSGLNAAEQLALEDENVRKSMAYARDHLGALSQ